MVILPIIKQLSNNVGSRSVNNQPITKVKLTMVYGQSNYDHNSKLVNQGKTVRVSWDLLYNIHQLLVFIISLLDIRKQ